MKTVFLHIIIAGFLQSGCNSKQDIILEDREYVLELPAGFPIPQMPEDNKLTIARVELGKKLFFDESLSADFSISCATCHIPEKAFADNKIIGTGIFGREGFRNVPSLFNIAYHEKFLKDGGAFSLEAQALIPISDHAEMDFSIEKIVERLKNNPDYKKLSKKAYDREFSGYVLIRALAAFQRTLISGNSRFDKFYWGNDLNALTSIEKEGFEIFKINCASCHSGFNFTNNEFENNGLYLVYSDIGRARITSASEDIGKFKIPSLRNVALTYPYMHDGSIATIEDVIEFYNSGGNEHPNKNERIKSISLNEFEKKALKKFLYSLTDQNLLETQQ